MIENDMNSKRNAEILKILEHCYFGAGPALKFKNNYELLVATMLSAQTTDLQVNRITASLFLKHPTPHAVALLSQEQLAEEIKSSGLFRNKAKNILAATRILLDEYAGVVPNTREELMRLPGVGRKTANVVLANGFGIPALGVDTHIFRVANRTGLTVSKNPEQTEQQLTRLIPEKKWNAAHHWLIWHGRKVCKAQKPLCLCCPLAHLCPSKVSQANDGIS